MHTGWVRLSRTCQNACVFCNEVDALDGTVPEPGAVTAAIDAVAGSGATEVVLSGGEPTLSRHLLAAIRHAKGRGLRVTLTTNGRIITSPKVAEMLAKAGLDEVRVSVHSGRRATHDALAGAANAWVEGLQGLRMAGRSGLRVVLRSILTRHNAGDLAHLMHLGTMAGCKGMELIRPRAEGRLAAPGALAELEQPPVLALRLLAELWHDAKEEVLLFTQRGWEDSVDLGLEVEFAPDQADEAALRMLRDRVHLHQAAQGLRLLDGQGMTKDVVALVEGNGGLSEVGHELCARNAPLLDAPWCVGGRPTGAAADDAVWGSECGECPERSSCPGWPKKLAKIQGDALRPPAHWRGVGAVTAAVVGGQDDALLALTLAELAAALTAEGARAVWSAAPGGAAVREAGLVVCGDAGVAAAVLGLPDRRPGQRVVVLDGGLGAGLEGLPGAPDVVVSHAPGHVGLLRAAGVALRTVHWRPFPAPLACRGAAPALDATRVVAFGEAGDPAALEAAVARAAGRMPVVEFYTRRSEGPPGTGALRVHTGVDDATLLDAITSARLVVHATGRVDPADPTARARAAHDLRWLGVAAAAARPIVATRGPGVEDAVRHDVTGWLEVPGIAALSEAVRRVATEPQRLARYHRAGLEVAASSSVAAFARELVHGARPSAAARVRTPTRPWPVW